MVPFTSGLGTSGAVVRAHTGGNLVKGGAMIDFTFQVPGVLPLLLLALPLWWMLAYARKRRREVIEAMGGGHSTHRLQRDLLRVASFVLMMLALARPGYSPRMESTSQTGRDVVFALDVSQSMLAEDVSPSRLEVAKQAVRDALKGMRTERVGLVVYAGSASVLCPLTYDYDFVRYMLEQAQPRTVDFGGTTLQSAVEKCADQVFIDGRGGMQDLVVLTDGGDNGSKMEKMVQLLEEKQVDVLLVGLGDPETGSPIPILDDEGNRKFLEVEGSAVLTKLDDAALHDLASKSGRVSYMATGTRPFDLGLLYQNFSMKRPHEAAETATGVRVYQEAAIFLMIPALIFLLFTELWGAMGLRLAGGAALFSIIFIAPSETRAEGFKASFKQAVALMDQGDYEKADTQFSEIQENVSSREAGPAEIGVLQFNRGLCLLKISENQTAISTTEALSTVLEAQRAFLAARRSAPDLRRAGVCLEMTAAVLATIREKVAAEEKANQEMQEELQKLVEKLQALLDAQEALRTEVASNDVSRNNQRRGAKATPAEPVIAPPDAAALGEDFSRKEAALETMSREVEADMKVLDKKMTTPMPGMPPTESVLTEPLKLMPTVEDAQARVTTELKVWEVWPAARNHGQQAEKTLREIIEMLANSNPDAGDSDKDSDQMDEDGENQETDNTQPAMPDSKPADGDLEAGAEMQELPVPNYSADDILKEEQGSLQFRQQKRSGANAAKVEKDY